MAKFTDGGQKVKKIDEQFNVLPTHTRNQEDRYDILSGCYSLNIIRKVQKRGQHVPFHE